MRKAAANSTFAIGGLTCFYDTFVVKESAVLRIIICGEKPAHLKSANLHVVKKLNFQFIFRELDCKINSDRFIRLVGALLAACIFFL